MEIEDRLRVLLCCCADDHTVASGGRGINIVVLEKIAEWAYPVATSPDDPLPHATAVMCDRCIADLRPAIYAIKLAPEGAQSIHDGHLERVPVGELRDSDQTIAVASAEGFLEIEAARRDERLVAAVADLARRVFAAEPSIMSISQRQRMFWSLLLDAWVEVWSKVDPEIARTISEQEMAGAIIDAMMTGYTLGSMFGGELEQFGFTKEG